MSTLREDVKKEVFKIPKNDQLSLRLSENQAKLIEQITESGNHKSQTEAVLTAVIQYAERLEV